MSSEDEAEMNFSDGEQGYVHSEKEAVDDAQETKEYDTSTDLDRDINFGALHILLSQLSKKKGFMPKMTFDEIENALKRPAASGILSKLATIFLRGFDVAIKGGAWDPALSALVAKRSDDFDDCFIPDEKRKDIADLVLQHAPESPPRSRHGVSVFDALDSPGGKVGEKRTSPGGEEEAETSKRMKVEKARARIKRFVREWGRPEEEVQELDVSSDEEEEDEEDEEDDEEAAGEEQKKAGKEGEEGEMAEEQQEEIKKRKSRPGLEGSTIVLDEFGDLTLEERLSIFCRLAELQLRENPLVALPVQVPKPNKAKGKGGKDKETSKEKGEKKDAAAKAKEPAKPQIDTDELFAGWRHPSLGKDRWGLEYYWYHDAEFNFRLVRWKPTPPSTQFRQFLAAQGITVGRPGRPEVAAVAKSETQPHAVQEPRSEHAEALKGLPNVIPDACRTWEVVCTTIAGLQEFREKFKVAELGQGGESELYQALTDLEQDIVKERETIERNRKRQEKLIQQLGGFSYSGPSRRSSRLAGSRTRYHHDEDDEEEEAALSESDESDNYVGGRMLRRRKKRINYNVDSALESMLENKDEESDYAVEEGDEESEEESFDDEDSESDRPRRRLRKQAAPVNTALSRAERARRRQLGLPADW